MKITVQNEQKWSWTRTIWWSSAFFNLDTQTYRRRSLRCKTKEMLGLVASMVLRCDDCIKYHLEKCEQDSDTEEIYRNCLRCNIGGHHLFDTTGVAPSFRKNLISGPWFLPHGLPFARPGATDTQTGSNKTGSSPGIHGFAVYRYSEYTHLPQELYQKNNTTRPVSNASEKTRQLSRL